MNVRLRGGEQHAQFCLINLHGLAAPLMWGFQVAPFALTARTPSIWFSCVPTNFCEGNCQLMFWPSLVFLNGIN